MNIQVIENYASFIANVLKALSNEKRLHIVCALHAGEKSVGQLEDVVNLSQSALSQHLARLRKDGLVHTRREAQTVYYSLNDSVTDVLLEALHRLEDHWRAVADALEKMKDEKE